MVIPPPPSSPYAALQLQPRGPSTRLMEYESVKTADSEAIQAGSAIPNVLGIFLPRVPGEAGYDVWQTRTGTR